MELQTSIVKVANLVKEDKMEYDGTTVLIYRIEYPQFHSEFYAMSLDQINRFFRIKAMEYQQYVTTELYNMAVEQYKFSVENNYPMNPYAAYVTYKITYNRNCILSLYFDQYAYMGGAHGNTIRYAYTFDLQNGNKVKLSQLFGCYLNYRNYIIKQVKHQIEKETEFYFENYETLVEETFNPKNFYCTPEGIVIYFLQYDIAPYSSGIREFLIPYGDCVIDPIKMCSFYN